MKVYRFAAAVLVLLLACPVLLRAQTHLTSASQLKSTDKTFTITPAAGTVYTGPSVTFSNPGEQLTFSRDVYGGFEVDQAGLNYGDTSFTNGTQLIGAGGFQGAGDGSLIELDFSTPVSEFGLNTEDFAGTNDSTGSYMDLFFAYDEDDQLIAAFSAPQAGQGSDLSFAGLRAGNDPIAYVQFSDTGYGGSNNFLFGNIEYAPAVAIVGSGAPPAPTPEPSSIFLLGSGLSALAFGGRRFARRAPRQ